MELYLTLSSGMKDAFEKLHFYPISPSTENGMDLLLAGIINK